jgi:Rieske 2Fe-2S family protein
MTMAPAAVFPPTLPGRYYTDPEIFEREKRNIFERQWQYVCRAEDVPSPGRFVRVTVGNENVIVVRGRDGELRAFLNVCRHRGSTLCLTDRGDVGRSIRCPYHSWTYRLDGSLMSAPNWSSMGAADKADFGLHPVHLGQWHGMVWLNLAEDPAPAGGLHGSGELEDHPGELPGVLPLQHHPPRAGGHAAPPSSFSTGSTSRISPHRNGASRT